MGIEKMSSFLSKFNLGKKTLIDLGSEKKGIIPNREWKKNNFKSKQNQSWYQGETVITGIGQGYMLATPLQLAMATAMIANRGSAFRPHLVRAIENIKTGELTYTSTEEINNLQHIKQEHWDIIHQGMVAVVNERRGTAYGIFQPNVSVAGKTGSSQVFSIDKSSTKEIPEELKDHGLFIGFAPLEKPKIALTIIVENGGGGRVSAAPVAEKIMQAILNSERQDGI
jgi:penicillin-binding protein 2